jgi:hypothetical protein
MLEFVTPILILRKSTATSSLRKGTVVSRPEKLSKESLKCISTSMETILLLTGIVSLIATRVTYFRTWEARLCDQKRNAKTTTFGRLGNKACQGNQSAVFLSHVFFLQRSYGSEHLVSMTRYTLIDIKSQLSKGERSAVSLSAHHSNVATSWTV